MKITKCKTCGAPIVWIRTTSVKSMPCDAELKSYKEAAGAREKIVTEDGRVLSCELSAAGTDKGYTPHWSTCKAPDQFRKEKPMSSNLSQLFDTYDTIIMFDTETTGLEPTAASRIIELAALQIKRGADGRIIMGGKMDAFVLLPPGEHIPDKIRELTGITDDMLADSGVPEETAAAQFERMMDGRTLLVAHNAQFDLLFIRVMFERTMAAGAAQIDTCDYIDSLTVYKDRAAYPHKLANAIEWYGLQSKVQNSHRAIDDVMALYCVVYAMASERMDLGDYVNTFGYNARYGIMQPALEKVTYRAQDFNDGLTDPEHTLPAIIRKENGDGEQLTFDDIMKGAAGA